MNKNSKHFYEFDEFRLDPSERQLLSRGREIPLTPKAYAVLSLLVEHSGHTLTKEDFMREVWGDSFVEDKNLADNISIVRQALGDDPKNPQYIKTIPRRGYRFVADVREVSESGPDLVLHERSRTRIVVDEELPPDTEVMQENVLRQRSITTLLPARKTAPWGRVALIIAACAVLGALVFAAYRMLNSKQTPVADQPSSDGTMSARTLAVLPFKPLVADSHDPALELGMTDALISKLSNIRQITVRPTTSVIKYAAEDQDLRAVASQLGVDVLLVGRVQKIDDRIRLSVQLVRASDGATVWAEKFDEKFTDIFTVQDTVSERAAQALALKLTGEERRGLAKRYTDNIEAYQLYLQGRQHWRTFTPAGREKSINYYNEALRIDPNYALAYTGLAGTYIVTGIYGPQAPAEVIPKAREAIRRALKLDEELAEAHTSYAAFKIFYERDWPGAERELKRAIELSPNNPDPPDLYGYYLTAMGRTEEAIISHRRAKELAPQWHIPADDFLDALFFARRYDEAITESRQMLRLEPNEGWAAWVLAKALNVKGLHDDAIAEIRARLDSPEVDEQMKGMLLAELGYAYAATGRRADLAQVIEQLKAKPDPWRPVQFAKIYAGSGDREQAFAWLTKAADNLFPFLYEVRVEPHFDGLRSDPRYAEILRRINLPPG